MSGQSPKPAGVRAHRLAGSRPRALGRLWACRGGIAACPCRNPWRWPGV